MSDEIEMPNEVLERHEHATEHQGHPAAAAPHKDRHAGRMTLIVILLAMAAAISGKGIFPGRAGLPDPACRTQ